MHSLLSFCVCLDKYGGLAGLAYSITNHLAGFQVRLLLLLLRVVVTCVCSCSLAVVSLATCTCALRVHLPCLHSTNISPFLRV
jgi:hypothetical protein